MKYLHTPPLITCIKFRINTLVLLIILFDWCVSHCFLISHLTEEKLDIGYWIPIEKRSSSGCSWTFISGICTIEGHLSWLPGLHPQLLSHFVDFLENCICRCKCVVALKGWGLQELVNGSLRYLVLDYPLCKSIFFLVVKGGPIVWLVELPV